MNIKKKIIVKKNITDWQIETDDGFVDFEGIIKTEPLNVLVLYFTDGSMLRCAENHVLFTEDREEVFCGELGIGNKILGKSESIKCIEKITKESEKESLYDLVNVNNKSSSYLTGGLLSHNCSFIGSSKTLIKPEILEQLESSEPIDIIDNCFRIYEQPIAGNTYVIGADSAKGTGGDFSVSQIIDITAFPFRQVAVYRNNEISTHKYADKVYEMAMKYNEAFVMCENNDVGQAVVNKLWHDLEYENLVNYTATKAGRADIGIRATKKTKSMGCDLLQEFFEDFLIEIFDLDTIYELSKFEETSTGIFKAEDGENDDTVMALLWALFIIKTNYVDRDDDIKASRDSSEEEYDDEPLAPIIIDGTGDEDPNFLFHN